MARKSVVELEIREVLAGADQAAVWFVNRTERGGVETCDWLRVEEERILEIRSFYDRALVREVLSPEERNRLNDVERGS